MSAGNGCTRKKREKRKFLKVNAKNDSKNGELHNFFDKIIFESIAKKVAISRKT
jgi:hypothetical protein